MASKRHEYRIDLRLFLRAGSKEQAAAFGKAVEDMATAMTKDFFVHKVSITGTHAEVEDLDADKGLDVVKVG